MGGTISQARGKRKRKITVAIISSQVIDATEVAIAYYLAKKQWNSEEFAALFCSVNPLVWARLCS